MSHVLSRRSLIGSALALGVLPCWPAQADVPNARVIDIASSYSAADYEGADTREIDVVPRHESGSRRKVLDALPPDEAAAHEPHPDGHLVQDGPYRFVRHPMYGSVLLLAAGAAMWLGSVMGWALFLALLAVLMAKARMEERWLEQRYPQYAEYRLRTYCLVPLVH